MIYTVKYRKVGSFFWKKLKNVKGDGVVEVGGNARWFILADESRVELPLTEMEFYFPPERFLLIKKQMEQEAGQAIPTNDGARG